MTADSKQDYNLDRGPAATAEAFSDDIHCLDCAYNLRACTSDRCPECGCSLTPLRGVICRIPWSERRERGRFRAYWQTVGMVMFRHRSLCEEVARPVSFADAQAFRWATVLHAFLPMTIAMVVVYLVNPPEKIPYVDPIQRMMQITTTGVTPAFPSFTDRAYAEVWPGGVLLVCSLLFLVAATGIPSYFFHPRQLSVPRQNTAVALSYYACAPLVLTVLPVIAVSLGLAVPDIWPVATGATTAVLLMTVVLLIWLIVLVHLARRTMPQIRMQSIRVAVCMPLCWVAAGGLTLVGLPVIVLYVLVVVASLR